MQCVILAGGLGTRIKSVAGDIPKALIPVNGKPFAFHQLDWLKKQGVSEVVYCIGHRGAMIRDTVGDGSDLGLKVIFSNEGDVLRGTGGAIRFALDQRLLAPGFFVLYADSYLPIDIEPVWRRSQGGDHATMVVIHNENRWDKSNVVFRDGQVVRYEKNLPDPGAVGMTYIDYGLAVLNRGIVEARIPQEQRFDLAKLYTALSLEGALLGHEVKNRFYEIGSPSGLAELRAYLSSEGERHGK